MRSIYRAGLRIEEDAPDTDEHVDQSFLSDLDEENFADSSGEALLTFISQEFENAF